LIYTVYVKGKKETDKDMGKKCGFEDARVVCMVTRLTREIAMLFTFTSLLFYAKHDPIFFHVISLVKMIDRRLVPTVDYRCDNEKKTLELGRHCGIIA
jgi:hypothetical protein